MAGPNIPTRVMMFRDFVPDKVRVFLCLFLASAFSSAEAYICRLYRRWWAHWH